MSSVTEDTIITAVRAIFAAPRTTSDEWMVPVGPRTMRAIEWETTERDRWAGRDRRRIKRERRKFVNKGR